MEVDRKTFKYFGEKLTVSWNYEKRLKTGQTIQSAVITVTDVDGKEVTSQIIDPASINVNGSVVQVELKPNVGIRGQYYYVLFMVTTLNPSAQLGQSLELEIR